MIHLCCEVPNEIYVACSGGPDSMAAVDFFRRGRKQVTIVHLDHGTDHGMLARDFVVDWAGREKIDVQVAEIREEKPMGQSWEEWWRNNRYEFFRGFKGPVVTAHHLDDVAEWWMYTACHGDPKLIPKRNGNVIRPFLLTPKADMRKWCTDHDVPWMDDPTNLLGSNARSVVRTKLMPAAYELNLGLRKVMRKKVMAAKNDDKFDEEGHPADVVIRPRDFGVKPTGEN